jgi:hypothetical protein
MLYCTLLGVIDGRPGKHRIAVCLQTGLTGQIQQQLLCRAVNQIFGQVGKNMRCALAERLEAYRVGGKCSTQIKRLSLCGIQSGQRAPSRRAVTPCAHPAHAASKS